MNQEIAHIINESFSLQTTENDFVQLLADKINDLIVHDFNKLISALYRADISEKKLNALLAEHKNEDAGKLIALLFIERQSEKIRSRRENRRDHNIDEEDRW